LGLFQSDRWQFKPLAGTIDVSTSIKGQLDVQTVLADSEIEKKISERNEARRAKDFKKSDAIRKELEALGIVIEDKPDGTSRWKR
jgi:cysteinyl-tRNA synthetase